MADVDLKALQSFDPNLRPQMPWGTFVRHRNPEWKIHRNRAIALNAVAGRQYAAVYEWSMLENQWKLAAQIAYELFNHHCTLCGASTVVHKQSINTYSLRYVNRNVGDDYYDEGTICWKRDRPRGKISDPLVVLFLCERCVVTHGR